MTDFVYIAQQKQTKRLLKYTCLTKLKKIKKPLDKAPVYMIQ